MIRDKIRVLRIITRLNIGGPALHAIFLSEGLNKERFETMLVAGKPDEREGDMSGFAKSRNVEVRYIPELTREICPRDLIAFIKLYKVIKEFKPHIVHTHTAKAGALGRLAGLLAGVPLKVHTFHGHVLEGYFGPLKTRLFLFIERTLGLFTDKIVAISEVVRDEVTKRFRIVPDSKCAIISLGLDLEDFLNNEKFKGAFRHSIGIDKDTVLVGIVGRLVPIKNHKVFIEAAKRVIDMRLNKKVMFVVIGDGALKEDLVKSVKERGLDGSILFTGWRYDLPAIYSDLDIVVLTSLSEGTPVSLIEASASSRAVVATDVGGVRDIIIDKETGMLARSNDVEGLANKIAMLITENDTRDRLGARGREYVRHRYSKDRLICDIEGLYMTMISSRSRK